MASGVYARTEEYKKHLIERLVPYIGLKGEKNHWYGKHHSKETKKKISEIRKGIHIWEGKQHPRGMLGKHHSKETKQKMSESKKGEKNYLYGKHISEQIKQKMSRCSYWNNKDNFKEIIEKRNKKISESLKGEKNQWYGKHFPEETRKKMGIAHLGEKSSFWKGGISFESYGSEFNNILREHIRKRDNHRCRECGKFQDNLLKSGKKIKLQVHHIDYNKKNNKPENLVSLCLNCHARTNSFRDYYAGHFMELIVK